MWTTGALLLMVVVLGCGMDKGPSGKIPQETVFLREEGTLASMESMVYATPPLPTDIASLEAILDVSSGGADLTIGVEDPPSDYFSNGPGPGPRKILITPASREPMQGRVWYVEVRCPFDQGADYSLTVQRSSPSQVPCILEQTGTIEPNDTADLTLEIPEEGAEALEIDLETLKGDVDLFVGLNQGDEDYSAANPGTGHDIVVVTPQSYVPLASGIWNLQLEAWEKSDYNLTARVR